mmetsp:Transcript_76228/g.123185  ORF Transcript_76228/g.123185 Transcript_76228/m.123185 type:complete len:282 (-) Transcript_76228:756-1601(-)
MPSLLASNFVSLATASSSFFRASDLFRALAFALVAVLTVMSLLLVHSLILCISLARLSLDSEGFWPGISGAFISADFSFMNSVQALTFSFATSLAASMALANLLTWSAFNSGPPSADRGSDFSFKVAVADSAPATTSSNSAMASAAFSSASCCFLANSALRSSCFCMASFSCWWRALTCSTAFSTSVLTAACCEPHFDNSFVISSASSFSTVSRSSALAIRTFCSTLRMATAALDSSCLTFISAIFFCWSSSFFLLASSNLFFASSCCFFITSCFCFWRAS